MSEQTLHFFCDPAEAVEITFHHNPKVLVCSRMSGANVEMEELTFPLAGRKYLRYKSGLISGQGNTLTLRSRRDQPATGIQAGDGMGTVTVLTREGGRSRSNKLENVRQIVVASNKVTVICKAAAPRPTPPTPDPNPNPPQPTGNDAALKQQNAKLKEQLKKATEIMNGLKTSVQGLMTENNQLKTQNTALQNAVAQGVDDLIAAQENGTISVNPEVQEKIRRLDALRRRQEEADRQAGDVEEQLRRQEVQTAAAQAQLQGLREQLSGLRSQEEVTNLDCEKAKEELEAIRVRLQMDGDIIALTDSRWLKNNSVTETLEEMDKKLDAVEKRIGFILNARETYENVVHASVLRDEEGGFVSAQAEDGSAQNPDEEEDDFESEN